MRAEIRSLGSLWVDDLTAWVPDREDWALPVRIVAGPDDGPGEESFDVMVCSVAWIADRVDRLGIIDGRHHVLVDSFNWASLSRYLSRRVSECQGDTWSEVAERLGRLGFWEFEDYRD